MSQMSFNAEEKQMCAASTNESLPSGAYLLLEPLPPGPSNTNGITLTCIDASIFDQKEILWGLTTGLEDRLLGFIDDGQDAKELTTLLADVSALVMRIEALRITKARLG
jgi:hypothetical protein